MTFYPSESEINDLAQQARAAAHAIARRGRRGGHPEEYNVPLEYRLSHEDYRLFMRLTRAYAHAEETHRPAGERYAELKNALRIWKAAGGNQETLL